MGTAAVIYNKVPTPTSPNNPGMNPGAGHFLTYMYTISSHSGYHNTPIKLHTTALSVTPLS